MNFDFSGDVKIMRDEAARHRLSAAVPPRVTESEAKDVLSALIVRARHTR